MRVRVRLRLSGSGFGLLTMLSRNGSSLSSSVSLGSSNQLSIGMLRSWEG